MARLGKPVTDFDFNWSYDDRGSFEALQERFEQFLKEKPVIRFGVADGYAFYLVESEKPLVLRHVLWCDNYMVQDALIRGLRLVDVRDMLHREATMRRLFGG